jgi:hypothetical protein
MVHGHGYFGGRLDIARIIRDEADFVDQLFNSGEKRLARILLLLPHWQGEQDRDLVPGITQEHFTRHPRSPRRWRQARPIACGTPRTSLGC